MEQLEIEKNSKVPKKPRKTSIRLYYKQMNDQRNRAGLSPRLVKELLPKVDTTFKARKSPRLHS